MAIHVTYKRSNGNPFTVIGDELQSDPMNDGGLVVFQGGNVKERFDAAALMSVRAAEDPGSTGVGLFGGGL